MERQWLEQKIMGILDSLIEKGFRFPIRVAIIANSDAARCGKFEPSEDGTIRYVDLAQSESDSMRMPINMMFVDARGEAARVVIANEEAHPQVVN